MTERRLGLVATLLLASVLVLIHYGSLLRSPNSHMVNTEGDGLKNYFTFAWHVEHDTSAFTFSGMNAPFGEHINYPDAQPLLSNLWRGVDAIFPNASNCSVGLENLLMLASLLLSALFLFLILDAQGVRWWVASLAAVAIALLSMQVLRTIQAHYALAYSWCIPSTIWIGMQHWRSTRPWRSMLVIFLFLSAWLWVHVYLGFIAATTLFLWALLVHPFRIPLKSRLSLLTAPVLALGLFQLITALTDTHSERTEHPVGFFTYQTNWTTLFVPDHMWDAPLISALWGGPSAENPESWSYLGMGALVMLAALLLAGGAAMVLKRWRIRPAHVLPGYQGQAMGGLMIASLLLLLLAFGWPFDQGLEGLFWKTPVIRQFRAPSRFAWVLYFVLSTYLVVVLWNWQRAAADRGVRWIPRALLFIGLSLYGYEGWYVHRFIGEASVDSINLFRYDQLTDDMQHMVDHAKGSNTVGLASLPYFHNGAEELMIPAHGQGLLLGQMLAYHTGIPMLSSSLTRTGLEEVRSGIRAFGPTWYDRPELPAWRASDTLLVLVCGDPDNAYDRSVLERTTQLVAFGDARLGKLSVGDLLRDERDAKRKEILARDTWHPRNGWLLSDSAAFFFNDTFDTVRNIPVRDGTGAFTGMKKDFNVLARFAPGTFDSTHRYIASFWYYNRGPMRCHAFVGIDEHDPETQEGWWDHYTDPRFSRTLDGDWSLVELPFTVRDAAHEITLFVTGEPFYPDSIHVDELLIRDAAVDVLRVDSLNGVLWYNGHRLRP